MSEDVSTFRIVTNDSKVASIFVSQNGIVGAVRIPAQDMVVASVPVDANEPIISRFQIVTEQAVEALRGPPGPPGPPGSAGGGSVNTFATLLGNGLITEFVIPQTIHGLASNGNLSVDVFEVLTGNEVLPNIRVDAFGTVTVSFKLAPTNDEYRLLIMG